MNPQNSLKRPHLFTTIDSLIKSFDAPDLPGTMTNESYVAKGSDDFSSQILSSIILFS
jgi:hypothetical protein